MQRTLTTHLRKRSVRGAYHARMGIVALVLIVGSTGCRRGTEPNQVTQGDTASNARPNFIVISLDTLGANRLGCYGYERATTPAMDRFADRGVRFAATFTQSTWTAPAHMSLFTGLYPTTHGVTAPGTFVSRTIATFPELFQEHGYRSFAYMGGSPLSKYAGFARGFERFCFTGTNGLELAVDMAEEQIEELGDQEPYLIFLHGFDLQAPYETPGRYATMFQSPGAEPFDRTTRREMEGGDVPDDMTPGHLRYLSDVYDGAIRRADGLLDSFFNFLEQRDELEHTFVVLLAVNGESFGANGRLGHLGRLDRECLHVPLLLAGPGVDRGVINTNVGLVDLFPTLLELAGISRPSVHGRSLATTLHGGGLLARPVFSEIDFGGHYRSLISGDWQLLVRAYDDTPQLFDVQRIAPERTNVAADNSSVAAELLALMPNPPTDILDHDVFGNAPTPQQESLSSAYTQP